MLTGQRRTSAHTFDGRVGLYVSIYNGFVAAVSQRLGNLVDIAELAGGCAASDDQAFAGRQRARDNFLTLPAPKKIRDGIK